MQYGPAFTLTVDAHVDTRSLIFTVTDDTGRAVGSARLIVGSAWTFTSLEVGPRVDRTVAAALCHCLVQTLRINRVRELRITLDEPARTLLAEIGLPPATGSVAAMLDSQRRINLEGYRLVTQGQGLDAVALPHPIELLTAAAAAARELAAAG